MNEKKHKTRSLTIRISEGEEEMIKGLKSHPHYINVSGYLRNCIKHLYERKMSKEATND